MPWDIKKVDGGYKVVTKATGHAHSKKPIPLKRAKAQLRALYASEPTMKEMHP